VARVGVSLVKQEKDQWLEDALDFVRDSLRANSVVGLDEHPHGAKMIEKGEPTLANLANNQQALPAIFVAPDTHTPLRQGQTLENEVRLEIQMADTITLQPLADSLDDQTAFREWTGKVYNEVLHLFEKGRAEEQVWDDWQPPNEPSNQLAADVGDKAVLVHILPMQMTINTHWINTGV